MNHKNAQESAKNEQEAKRVDGSSSLLNGVTKATRPDTQGGKKGTTNKPSKKERKRRYLHSKAAEEELPKCDVDGASAQGEVSKRKHKRVSRGQKKKKGEEAEGPVASQASRLLVPQEGSHCNITEQQKTLVQAEKQAVTHHPNKEGEADDEIGQGKKHKRERRKRGGSRWNVGKVKEPVASEASQVQEKVHTVTHHTNKEEEAGNGEVVQEKRRKRPRGKRGGIRRKAGKVKEPVASEAPPLLDSHCDIIVQQKAEAQAKKENVPHPSQEGVAPVEGNKRKRKRKSGKKTAGEVGVPVASEASHLSFHQEEVQSDKVEQEKPEVQTKKQKVSREPNKVGNAEESGVNSGNTDQQEPETNAKKRKADDVMHQHQLEQKRPKRPKGREKKIEVKPSVASKEACLSYLHDFGTGVWKFCKIKQRWLLRHAFDASCIGEDDFQIFLRYVENMRGAARLALQKSANDILDKHADGEPTEEYNRARSVIEMLAE